MSEENYELEPVVLEHLTMLAEKNSTKNSDEVLDLFVNAWKEKMAKFSEIIAENRMEEKEFVPSADDNGALLLTYSGSIITLGPLQNGMRSLEYLSIGIRHDVPESLRSEAVSVDSDLCLDESVEFSQAPLKNSSAIYKIAQAKGEMAADEEIKLLSDVTQLVADDFLNINKSLAEELI